MSSDCESVIDRGEWVIALSRDSAALLVDAPPRPPGEAFDNAAQVWFRANGVAVLIWSEPDDIEWTLASVDQVVSQPVV